MALGNHADRLVSACSLTEVRSLVGFDLPKASERTAGAVQSGEILLGDGENALDIDLDTRQIDGLHHEEIPVEPSENP